MTPEEYYHLAKLDIDINHFEQLENQGTASLITRIGLLVEQEKKLIEQQKEIESNLKFLRKKKQHYYNDLEHRVD